MGCQGLGDDVEDAWQIFGEHIHDGEVPTGIIVESDLGGGNLGFSAVEQARVAGPALDQGFDGVLAEKDIRQIPVDGLNARIFGDRPVGLTADAEYVHGLPLWVTRNRIPGVDRRVQNVDSVGV